MLQRCSKLRNDKNRYKFHFGFYLRIFNIRNFINCKGRADFKEKATS